MIRTQMCKWLLAVIALAPVNCFAQGTTAPPKHTLLELRLAANNTASFDSGLTAELLIAHWLVAHGLKTNDAVNFFLTSVTSRTDCEVPGWWKNRFIDVFTDATVDPTKYSAQESASYGSFKQSVIKFGVSLFKSPEGFVPHDNIFGAASNEQQFLVCASSTGRLTDLVSGFVEDTGKKDQKAFKSHVRIPLRSWCPIMEDLVLDDSLKDACRAGTVELRHSGNVLLIFGDSGNHLFLSAVDLEGKKCKFCFRVTEPFEATCLGCSLEDILQSPRIGF
ncbi:MAG: hypothetical protein SFV81_22450 [Pirellulaceae bacterium]|nr:hypothetical protein [Pirellulaceae bacterium]